MKIIVVGDIHIKHDNIQDTEKLLTIVENNLHEIDAIVLLGDILHSHEKVFIPCMNMAYKFISELASKKHVYVIVGNHDMQNNQQFMSDQHWMNAMKQWKGVTVIDKAMSANIKNQQIVMCPYVPPGRLKEALSIVPEWESSSVIFCHQEFKNAKMGAFCSEIGDDWSNEYPFVISGHIHLNQKISNVYYPGVPIQQSMSDPSNTIIARVMVNSKDDIKIEEITTNLGQKKFIKFSSPDDIDVKADYTNCKLIVTCSMPDIKSFKKTAKYSKLVKAGINIVFKPVDIKTEHQSITKPNFLDVIYNLVQQENNSILTEMYKTVFEY